MATSLGRFLEQGDPAGPWTFVQEVVLGSPTATLTLPSLDGDADVEYLILLDIFYDNTANGSAFGNRLHLRPNGLTTNLSSTMLSVNGTGVIGLEDLSVMDLALLDAAANSISRWTGELRAYARRVSGTSRYFRTQGVFATITSGSGAIVNSGAGRWNEDATNLTSIVLRLDTGNVHTGSRARVYKRA